MQSYRIFLNPEIINDRKNKRYIRFLFSITSLKDIAIQFDSDVYVHALEIRKGQD